MKDLTPELETLVHQDALEEALSKLKCVEPELKSATEFKKIKANLLLATYRKLRSNIYERVCLHISCFRPPII